MDNDVNDQDTNERLSHTNIKSKEIGANSTQNDDETYIDNHMINI